MKLDESIKTLAPESGGPARPTILRSFVDGLTKAERAEFDEILSVFNADYPTISPVQRGVMAVCYMIQIRLLGKGYLAMTHDDKELTQSEKSLLEWARRTYDTTVNDVISKRETGSDDESFGKILKQFLDDEHRPDAKPRREFKRIPLADVEAEAARKGLMNKAATTPETEAPLPTTKKKTAAELAREENGGGRTAEDTLFLV